MKQNILFIGCATAVTNHYSAIQRNSVDYDFYCITDTPPLYPELFKKIITVNFSDWGEMSRVIKNLNIEFHGVLCLDDILTNYVDDISELLGCNRISSLRCYPYRFKDRMRIICDACDIKVPKYQIISRLAEYSKVINWNFPVIVKPTSFLASIGVKKVYNFKQLAYEVNNQLNTILPIVINDKTYELGEIYNLEKRVLIEEFIAGEEYSLESVVSNSRYIPIGVTKKLTNEVHYMDEIGHIFPAQLDQNQLNNIYTWGEKLHKAFKINNVTTHTEFRIDSNGEIYLIELGARIPGDCIHKLIENSLIEDFSFFDTYLNARLGVNIHLNCKTQRYTGVAFIEVPPHMYGKTLNNIEYNIEKLSSTIIETEYFHQIGDILPVVGNWSNERVMRIILENDNYNQLFNDIKYITQSSIIS